MVVALLAEDVVHLALARDRVADALELMGATDSLRVELDAPRPPAVAATLDEALAPGASTIGEATVDAARRRGQALNHAAMGDLMRRVCEAPVPAAVP